MSNTWDSLYIATFYQLLTKGIFALAVPGNGDPRKLLSFSLDNYNNLRLASFPSAENTQCLFQLVCEDIFKLLHFGCDD